MRKKCWSLVLMMGALALATIMMPSAQAECGPPLKQVKPSAWQPLPEGAHLMKAAFPDDAFDHADAASIVGMWHVTFTGKTMNGAAFSGLVDNALVVWHSDKTEIMNSGRPPQDGNFCMGVWEQTGRFTYKLNHFAWGGNNYTPGTPNGVVGDPIGPVHYVESVTLNPDGKHYSGTFTLNQYDTSGNVQTTITGVITATRITVDTTAGDLL